MIANYEYHIIEHYHEHHHHIIIIIIIIINIETNSYLIVCCDCVQTISLGCHYHYHSLIAWTTYLNENDDDDYDDYDSDDHQQYIKYVGHKVHTVRSTKLTVHSTYSTLILPPRGKQKSETSCGGGSIAYGYLKRISALVEATPSLVSESMISFNVSGLLS